MDERTQKVLAAVQDGRITAHEADAYLRATTGKTYAEVAPKPAQAPIPPSPAPARPSAVRERALLALLVLVPILLIIGLSYGGTLSGLVVLDIPPSEGNTSIMVSEPVTALNITGALRGEGSATVYFDTPDRSYIVANIASDDGSPRTAHSSYAPGDAVLVEHAPERASYYFDDGATSTAVGLPLNATVNGTLLIVANDSGTLRTFRLPIIIGDVPRTTLFEQLCVQTCALNATNGTLRIETSGDATVAITRVDAATLAPNRPPQLAVALPTMLINHSTTINLDDHFVDPDGDRLSYALGSSDLVATSVNGSLLTITPSRSGNEILTLYASDLGELIQASLPIIVVLPPAGNISGIGEDNISGRNGTNETDTIPPMAQNSTVNETLERNTAAANATANGTMTLNASAGTALDCSNPDPNLRPVDCVTMASARLLEEDIFWEDVGREKVARFTQIGNLLITGKVIKGDVAGNAGSGDFAIGYTDDQFARVNTIWIDAAGNLHLRGTLHEVNGNIIPPQGSYVVINRRGVYLAYADVAAGDLYLRGNVIPYRDDVHG